VQFDAHMKKLLCTSAFRGALALAYAGFGLFMVLPARAQAPATPSQQDDNASTGTIVSSTRNTLVVRNENGQYQLFVFDRDTVKPATLTAGSNVRIVSIAGEESGVRVARLITSGAASGTQANGQNPQNVPPEVRRLERDIERQARRYQLGVRAGMSLDPELVLIGVQAQVGPLFNPNVYFRPNVEFAFGEVTALFALNAEAIYRLPVSSRQGRWSPYVGAGPAFTFLHQNFSTTTNSGNKIDFGDFHSSVGLNILGGLSYRSGMFMELKTSVYSNPAPTLRFIIGYNF
jgi:opacity protein-like surface antigen